MTDPWLTVVMPSYNGGRYVTDALSSIEAQHPAEVHVVVVDDGSSDDTVDLVRSFEDRLSMTVIDGVGRGNWVAASNEGLRRVRTGHACFLHQDDLWLPGRLRTIRSLVERFPAAAMWVQGAAFVDPRNELAGTWRLPLRGPSGLAPSDHFTRRLLVQNFLCIAGPVFRPEKVLGSGGLDESLWYTADWDLWLRLAGTGGVAFDNSPRVGFRVHPESQTATRTSRPRDMEDQLSQVLRVHLDRWASRHPGSQREAVERLASASVALNVALASASHGDTAALVRALVPLLRLGPVRAATLLRYSRVSERVLARVRAALRARRLEGSARGARRP